MQRKTEHLEEERNTLGEKNSWIERILRSLEKDGQAVDIINRLKRGESHRQIAEWLGRPLVPPRTGGSQSLSPTTERNITEAIAQYHGDLVEHRDPRYWTNVTSEAPLIEHLVNLYFTWIHPVHMLLDQGHFMSSFKACSDTYCSSALVNVICAMACSLVHDESCEDDELTNAGIVNIKEKFLNETRALMRNTDHDKMTAIQTYAIMFLVDLGCGNGLMASSHLRLAAETLLSKSGSEQSSESEELAAWGILTLQMYVSNILY